MGSVYEVWEAPRPQLYNRCIRAGRILGFQGTVDWVWSFSSAFVVVTLGTTKERWMWAKMPRRARSVWSNYLVGFIGRQMLAEER